MDEDLLKKKKLFDSMISNKLQLPLQEPPSLPPKKSEEATFSLAFQSLKKFLKFGYWHSIVPFKLYKDKEGNWQIKSNRFNKITVFLVMSTNILYRLHECREIVSSSPANEREWTPNLFFLVFYGYCNIFFHCTLWFTLWNNGKLVKIYQFLERAEYVTKGTPQLLKPIVQSSPYISWTIIIVFALLNFFNGPGLVSQLKWNLHDWFHHLVSLGYDFFLIPNSTVPSDPMSALDIMIGTLMCGVVYFRFVAGFFEEMFLLHVLASVWICSLDFVNRIEHVNEYVGPSPQKQWEYLKKTYLELRGLIDLVNDLIWPNIAAHTLLSLFYYSFQLDALFLTNDVIRLSKVLIYFFGGAGFYFVGADICSQVKKMEVWLSKVNLENSGRYLTSTSSHELSIILYELQTNRLGILCSKCFTLTYGMLASMVSIVMTYFIICVQYRMNARSGEMVERFNL